MGEINNYNLWERMHAKTCRQLDRTYFDGEMVSGKGISCLNIRYLSRSLRIKWGH